MAENIIEFRNIYLAFEGKEILRDFNLKVLKGDKIILSAPSGSGKTTLLKLILGFNKPNSGEIWVEEEKLDELSVDKIRKKIGYLSQKMSFRNLVVKEVIDEILGYKSNREIIFEEKKMEEILEYLKLDKKIIFQEMNDLSGGEKQRIGFLIAILMDREIWIFDEITSSLDKELKELVIDYILKSEKTVIMVSHDKTESLEKFKKVVI
ncbi:MAG: ABC transporter ATP-binding protein [Fusobacteriaceae bacterium]